MNIFSLKMKIEISSNTNNRLLNLDSFDLKSKEAFTHFGI